jgi:hypothetical protein
VSRRGPQRERYSPSRESEDPLSWSRAGRGSESRAPGASPDSPPSRFGWLAGIQQGAYLFIVAEPALGAAAVAADVSRWQSRRIGSHAHGLTATA